MQTEEGSWLIPEADLVACHLLSLVSEGMATAWLPCRIIKLPEKAAASLLSLVSKRPDFTTAVSCRLPNAEFKSLGSTDQSR